MYLQLFVLLSSGFSASEGMANDVPNFTASSIRPSWHSVLIHLVQSPIFQQLLWSSFILHHVHPHMQTQYSENIMLIIIEEYQSNRANLIALSHHITSIPFDTGRLNILLHCIIYLLLLINFILLFFESWKLDTPILVLHQVITITFSILQFILFSPSALCIMTSTDFPLFVVTAISLARPHGIRSNTFIVYLQNYALSLRLSFESLLSSAILPTCYASYSVPVRQATISLLLPLAHVTVWSLQTLLDSSLTARLREFHPGIRTCP